MALPDRIIGPITAITADGSKTDWNELTFVENESDAPASSSDSSEDEIVRLQKHFTGKLTGFLGSANNAGTLPAIGDTISDLAVAVGSDQVLPDLSGYTNIKVVAPRTFNIQKNPATWELNIRSGVKN